MIHIAATPPRVRRPLRLVSHLAIAIFFPAADARALDQAELDTHRAAWDSHNIADYNYIMQRQCRCSGFRLGMVSVRSDAIVSVVDANTFEPLVAHHYLTVDQLFDELQTGLGQPGYNVTAEFDPSLNYPLYISLNHPQIADEEVVYIASDLIAVPEPSCAVIAITLAVIGFLSVTRRMHR